MSTTLSQQIRALETRLSNSEKRAEVCRVIEGIASARIHRHASYAARPSAFSSAAIDYEEMAKQLGKSSSDAARMAVTRALVRLADKMGERR